MDWRNFLCLFLARMGIDLHFWRLDLKLKKNDVLSKLEPIQMQSDWLDVLPRERPSILTGVANFDFRLTFSSVSCCACFTSS
jgi:hypothetical protein